MFGHFSSVQTLSNKFENLASVSNIFLKVISVMYITVDIVVQVSTQLLTMNGIDFFVDVYLVTF